MKNTPLIKFNLTNDVGELRRLAEFVDQFCLVAETPSGDRRALQVALEEVALNVIKHGYRDGQAHVFSVTLESESGWLIAKIEDDAPAYDLLARPEVDVSLPLDQRPIGGLGVHLVKKLMQAHYERKDGVNLLTLRRRCSESSEA